MHRRDREKTAGEEELQDNPFVDTHFRITVDIQIFCRVRSHLPGSGEEISLDSGYQPTPFAVVRSYEETYSFEEI